MTNLMGRRQLRQEIQVLIKEWEIFSNIRSSNMKYQMSTKPTT